MKRLMSVTSSILVMLFTLSGIAQAGTLDDVKKKGFLQCGINTGLPGFAFTDDKGDWRGFDVDYCRAVAAAVLGDANKVKYTNLTGKTRFTALNSGEIDLLSRNTTWTFSRDVDLKLTFVGVSYYDGQGFIVPKKLGVKSAKELDGASVCIQTGTTTELNLADFFRSNKIKYEPVPIETNEEARTNYAAGRCDVYTTDRSGLAATRVTFKNPDDHVVMPDVISKEPLGPVVRQGDDQWADVARWTLNVLIDAEDYGVNSNNVDTLAKGGDNPEVNRMLGAEGDLGGMLGLSKNWAHNVIKQVGNYSEIFERNIGSKTPIKLTRGLNALYRNGGILYAPPMR